MGDKVILVDAGVAGEGWAHGRNLATGEIGWFPETFAAWGHWVHGPRLNAFPRARRASGGRKHPARA
eukprot:2906533-Pyramimonas_sp.AAC.1